MRWGGKKGKGVNCHINLIPVVVLYSAVFFGRVTGLLPICCFSTYSRGHGKLMFYNLIVETLDFDVINRRFLF